MLMFLQVMNEEEKENFLELVYKIANVDGDYAEEEKELIDSYKKELNLNTIPETSTIDELVKYFSEKTIGLKKIVLFETIGMINADNIVAKEETEVFDKMVASFEFDAESVKELKALAEKLQSVYDEIYEVLFD